jgi:hypothetical protein
MNRIPCPYCSQIVESNAIACSTCGGLLTIGSHMAISQALAADPTLSLKDPDSVARLKEFVSQIDESIAKTAQLKQDEVDKLRKEAELRDQILREQEVAEKTAKNKARQEYLESVSPQKRFLIVRKVPIAITLVLIAIAAVVAPSQLSELRENQRIEAEKNYKEQAAAQELDDLKSTAGQQIADLEGKYCVVLKQVVDNKELDLLFAQNTDNFMAIDNVIEDSQNEATEIYNSYTGLRFKLGSEASKFSSPLLEKHVVTWDYDSWWRDKRGKATWIQAYSLCS